MRFLIPCDSRKAMETCREQKENGEGCGAWESLGIRNAQLKMVKRGSFFSYFFSLSLRALFFLTIM